VHPASEAGHSEGATQIAGFLLPSPINFFISLFDHICERKVKGARVSPISNEIAGELLFPSPPSAMFFYGFAS
jgi:hypothetical protein